MGKRRGLTADDIDIWRRAMRTTTALPGRDLPPASPKPKPKPAPARGEAPSLDPLTPASKPLAKDHSRNTAPSHHHSLDGATARRVRRGQLSVEGRIDLHGMRQDEAHSALTRFIIASATRGRRCVLVITGKGGRAKATDFESVFMARRTDRGGQGEGVLKRMVPLWLGQDPLRHRIFSIQSAHPKDGGSGALYVFLKRGRT